MNTKKEGWTTKSLYSYILRYLKGLKERSILGYILTEEIKNKNNAKERTKTN